MVARKQANKDCCKDAMNLPEELVAALQKYGGLNGLKKNVPQRESLTSESTVDRISRSAHLPGQLQSLLTILSGLM